MTVDDCVQIIEAQRILLDARESHIAELVRQMSVLVNMVDSKNASMQVNDTNTFAKKVPTTDREILEDMFVSAGILYEETEVSTIEVPNSDTNTFVKIEFTDNDVLRSVATGFSILEG